MVTVYFSLDPELIPGIRLVLLVQIGTGKKYQLGQGFGNSEDLQHMR